MNARNDHLRSPAAMLAEVNDRAREFYFAPDEPMQLDLIVADVPGLGCRLHLNGALHVTAVGEPSPELPPGAVAAHAATLKLPARALEFMLEMPHEIDTANARVRANDHKFELAGSPGVLLPWLQLLKRPLPENADALALARAQAPLRARESDLHDDTEVTDIEAAVRQAIADRLPRRIRRAVSFRGDCTTLRKDLPFGGYTVARAPQEILDSIRWPDFPPEVYVSAQIFAGFRTHGVKQTLHCDVCTSLLAHLEGRKRVMLFAPGMGDSLYASDAYNNAVVCRVDPSRPDVLERFPRFADAVSTYLELEPGDLLVIPTGWYHYVWADEPVSSVSRFVRDARLLAIDDAPVARAVQA